MPGIFEISFGRNKEKDFAKQCVKLESNGWVRGPAVTKITIGGIWGMNVTKEVGPSDGQLYLAESGAERRLDIGVAAPEFVCLTTQAAFVVTDDTIIGLTQYCAGSIIGVTDYE